MGHPGYCPACFSHLDQAEDTCPSCGARMVELSDRAFGDKLLHALHHPLAEVRMRAVIALGLRAEPPTAAALVECALRHPTDVVAGIEIVERLARFPEGPERSTALARLDRHPAHAVRIAAHRARRSRLERRSTEPASTKVHEIHA